MLETNPIIDPNRMTRKTKGLLAGAVLLPAGVALTLYYLAKQHGSKIEPYIRDQAVAYLQDRFDAEAVVERLEIDVPAMSPIKAYMSKGRGIIASVTGHNILLRRNAQSLLRMNTLRFEVDLGEIYSPNKGVTVVYLDGVEIVVPPKGEQSRQRAPSGTPPKPGPRQDITIGEVIITNATLTIKPRDPKRHPMQFDLHRIRLIRAGVNVPMRYEAELRNAKPPGEITANGNFGHWNRDEPGDTALDGDFKFERANLAVFSGIGGILNSTGHFQGKLNDIAATGEATVPEFYLKASGNKLPLQVKYEVQVDGTNGNTILKPVHGRIGRTSFVTSGGVVKHDGDQRRTIELDVNLPAGRMEDVLLLAMRGKDPFMSGTVQFTGRILVPPLSGKVVEKLRLGGQFKIKDGKFLRTQIQDRIDQMSRQAQGEPKNEEIDEVVSVMSGKFKLANEVVTMQDLAFSIPGADLRLNGDFHLDNEVLDFHGDLRLKARLSQTQSGWKRWALKPVDPFFAKKGAGLYTKIKVTGTRKDPKFGREK